MDSENFCPEPEERIRWGGPQGEEEDEEDEVCAGTCWKRTSLKIGSSCLSEKITLSEKFQSE